MHANKTKTEGNRFFLLHGKTNRKFMHPFYLAAYHSRFRKHSEFECILWDRIKLFSDAKWSRTTLFFAESKNNTGKYRWFAVSRFDSSRLPEFEGDAQWLWFNCMGVALECAHFSRLLFILVFYNSLSVAIFIIMTPKIWFSWWIFIQIIKFKVIGRSRLVLVCWLTYGHVQRGKRCVGTGIAQCSLRQVNQQFTFRRDAPILPCDPLGIFL